MDKNDHKEWIENFKPLHEMEYEKVIRPAIHPTNGPLLMGEIVNAVAEATGGEAILVNDVGLNQMFSSRYFKYNRKRSIISSGGLGTMGYGMPAAIGATFGAPDRIVCMFTGDGGLQMSIQELGTIMEQQCPVKIILMNNNYLGNVRQWQDMFYNKRRSFTHMLNPDYGKISAAYGIPYSFVSNRDELEGGIEKMLASDGPYILECAVKEEENVLPMIPPGKSIGEMLLVLNLLMTMETTTKTLYTLLVYSENLAGILNQITAVFTRRQVNIESLNVSASSIEGVHKYTITAWSDEDQIIKITKQIEKKIDVIKADYYTDDQLFIREEGLYKVCQRQKCSETQTYHAPSERQTHA